jgi:hypothetical protein
MTDIPEGWKLHDGGARPVSAWTRPKYILRDGTVCGGQTENAHKLRWDHIGYWNDIIAYCPETEDDTIMTFGEIVERIADGTFYEDYDWASQASGFLRAMNDQMELKAQNLKAELVAKERGYTLDPRCKDLK